MFRQDTSSVMYMGLDSLDENKNCPRKRYICYIHMDFKVHVMHCCKLSPDTSRWLVHLFIFFGHVCSISSSSDVCANVMPTSMSIVARWHILCFSGSGTEDGTSCSIFAILYTIVVQWMVWVLKEWSNTQQDSQQAIHMSDKYRIAHHIVPTFQREWEVKNAAIHIF